MADFRNTGPRLAPTEDTSARVARGDSRKKLKPDAGICQVDAGGI